MKQTYIWIAFAMLVLLSSCSDALFKESTNNSRHIIITAQMPDDGSMTRASLTQKEGSLDMIAQWHEGDRVVIVIGQNGMIFPIGEYEHNGFAQTYSHFAGIPVDNISEDGKSCTINFDLPEGVDENKPYRVFGSYGIDNVYYWTEGEEELTLQGEMKRVPLEEYKLPLYMVANMPNEKGGAKFKHFLAYEILHIKNIAESSITFSHEGFDISEGWYNRRYLLYLTSSGAKINGDVNNYNGDNESGGDISISPGKTRSIIAGYIPSGLKIADARLKAIINGEEVLSFNTKSSDVQIETGKAYHLFATWDGNELKFCNESVRETIIYPTSSYKLSEDRKTLLYWIGPEQDIYMDCDPAFDNVEIIDENAFSSSRSSYNSIHLSRSVKTIESYAFSDITLNSLFLPESLTIVEAGAFRHSKIQEVHIQNIEMWCNIDFRRIWLTLDASNPLENAQHFFINGKEIVDLIIPENVSEINQFCFKGAKIETLKISNGVKKIDKYAFANCEKLRRIDFGETLERIDAFSFDNCNSLGTISLPECLSYVGTRAFNNCNNIESIYLGENFLGDASSPFRCRKLKEFVISANNKYYKVVEGVLYHQYDDEHLWLMKYPAGKEVEEYSILNTTEDIVDDAFLGCDRLTKLIIPYSCTSIGYHAFDISEVPNLKTIVCHATNPPVITYHGYSGPDFPYDYGYAINYEGISLYVPEENLDAYKKASYWSDFVNIHAIGDGSLEGGAGGGDKPDVPVSAGDDEGM